MNKLIFSLLLTTFFSASMAQKTVNLDLLNKRLNNNGKVISAVPSIIPGLFEVTLNGGVTVYLSADGEKLIDADIYDLRTQKKYVNPKKIKATQAKLANIKDSDKIIYKAKKEKYKVMVFTDITCPYCTKLHKNIQAYNDAGITIEYLAYPRAGVGSEPAKNMQKIWCAPNKALALDQAKFNHKLPSKTCKDTQVVDQFNLGISIGVNATPTLVFSDGSLSPGYLNAADLLSDLQTKFSK